LFSAQVLQLRQSVLGRSFLAKELISSESSKLLYSAPEYLHLGGYGMLQYVTVCYSMLRHAKNFNVNFSIHLKTIFLCISW